MNGVAGMASVLADSSLDDEQRELVDGISESSEILLTLINELLDGAQLESGEFTPKRIEFDPHLLTRSLQLMMGNRCKRKKLQFEIHINRHFPRKIVGDFEKIRQILLSLLLNSYKYTQKGRILLSLSRGQELAGDLHFLIADTGIGMDEKTLTHLFEPFHRSDDPDAQAQSGNGLGMSICRDLARRMGGDIKVRSHKDKGSEFILALPCEVARPQLVPNVQPTTAKGPTEHRVVVIEDTESGPGILSTQLRGLPDVQVQTINQFAELDMILEALDDASSSVIVWVNAERLDDDSEHILARYVGYHHVDWVYYTHAGQRGDMEKAEMMGFDAYLSSPISNKLAAQCHDFFRTLDRTAPARKPILTRFDISDNEIATSRQVHALIVDDEPFNCKMMAMILNNLGHTSESVTDHAEIHDRLATGEVDVIFLDQQLIGALGTDIAKELSEHPAFANIPIILVSGMDCETEETRQHVFSFLGKPVNLNRVRGQLERLEHNAPRI